jgi:hypothetical protein
MRRRFDEYLDGLTKGKESVRVGIHTATERYQDLGMQEDAYAEPSDRFSDLNTAINCMLSDCGFVVPEDPQIKLFEEVEI